MTTNLSHSVAGPAKIYQFPPRGRFAGPSASEAARPVPGLASPGLADIAFGSSWYHEEAVQEERTR